MIKKIRALYNLTEDCALLPVAEHEGGASVTDVLPSVNGKWVETIADAAQCLIQDIPFAGFC